MTLEPMFPRTAPPPSWRQAESLIEEIAAVAESGVSREEFHAALLDRMTPVVGAVGGAIWTRTREGLLHLERQANLGKTGLPESRADQLRHALLLDETMRHGAARTVAPRSGSVASDEGANPTPQWLALAPVNVEGSAVAVLETFHSAESAPDELREALQLLTEIAVLASDYYRGEQLRQLRQERDAWERINRFVEATYGRLDVQAAAFAAANEGRAAIGCDRVSVAVVRRGVCHIEAISGVDWFDRRSADVRRLERIAHAVFASHSTIRYCWSDHDEPLPPQVEQLLQSHVDESPCRSLAVFPLDKVQTGAERSGSSADAVAVGVLIAEHFQGRLEEPARRRAELIVRHTAAALTAACEFDQIPFAAALQAIGGGPLGARLRRLPRAAWLLLAVLLSALALAVIPTDFTIEAPGELQPQIRRDVFAPSDGVVVELLARHDMPVRRGDVLAVLEDVQLDYEFRRLEGEIQTAQKRLAAIEALRLDSRGAAEEPRRWTAEKEEVEELLAGLARQREVLIRRQKELTIRSPLDGRIITWAPERQLQSRPVARGQRLLTVADLNGPWVIELEAPDRRMGHIAAAQQAGGDLEVNFIREMAPTHVHRGKLQHVALTADPGENQEHTVQLIASIEGNHVENARPGAVVQAQIHCGRRSLGYVWLHEIWEAWRRNVWF